MNITLAGTKVSMDGHTLAFQKNNIVDSMVITVDTDETWQYKLDVKYPCKDSKGEQLYNVIDLTRVGNTCTAIMQASMLPFNGKYTMQLRGISGNKVYHTDTFDVWVKYSIDPSKVYDPIPSEFYQIEQAVAEQAANAKQSETNAAESAKQAAESSTNAAESANEAHKSREAIENMEVSAVSLSPDSDATVEKAIADGKVKLTFGIPKGEKGESDIFWLNATSSSEIAETFDEIVAAYKAGKNIWIRDTQSFPGIVATAPAFLVRPIEDDAETNILGMLIICGGSVYGSSDLTGSPDGIMNVTYYIIYDPRDPSSEVYFYLNTRMCAELKNGVTPIESQFNGSAGRSTAASPVDHIHPAPFPNWTNNTNKALFVRDENSGVPSDAFEWRDVPNGDFTSKVGDFLRVAEVDSNNKPTKWTTDSAGGAKEPMIVTFTITDMSTFALKADTPYADIVEAANKGRIVYAFVPEPVGPLFGLLAGVSSYGIAFSAFNDSNGTMTIIMESDSYIHGTANNLLVRTSDIVGGGDFDARFHRIKNVNEPTYDSDAATKGYVDKSLSSSTSLGITSATVGQFLKVAEVDTQGKPIKWTTDSITNAKGVNF